MYRSQHVSNDQTRVRRSVSLLAMGGLCAFLALAGQAEARGHSTSVNGPGGQTASREVLRQNGDVSSTTTGPNGKTSSRVVDRSAGGTTSTMTGFNGKTASRQTTRTESGSTTTVTGPEGQSGTVTVTH